MGVLRYEADDNDQTLGRTIRQYPGVLLLPLLAWVLLAAGGILAVWFTAEREASHRRELAEQIAADKGMFLETELAKVFLPAYVCSVYVRRDPSWAAVNKSFAPTALEMIRLSNAGSVLTLSLIPNGVIYTMVPLRGSSPTDDPNWRAIGKDWLQDRFNQDKVLHALQTRNLTIIGPYNLTQGGIGMVAMLSINIPDSPPDATFDVPPYVHGALGPWQAPPRTQPGPNLTNTPFAPFMYDNATPSRWWGLTTVLISWDILRDKVARLDDLEALGYRYLLSRPAAAKELVAARPDLAADGAAHDLAVAWSASLQPVDANTTNNRAPPPRPGAARPLIYYDLDHRLVDPVHMRLAVEGAVMDLYIEPAAGGWVPDWRDPLFAVVTVVSLFVALLLFVILISRRFHLRLLHAMLPKKVISTLRRGDIFAESFETVTILFSDIVSYTDISAQMEPIDVVRMLDELYRGFDGLCEKHKLYKVETIGDAFMAVGGAPDQEDAAAAAARVARMALDMVELTRTTVLSGGQVVRIRVGIHSGPIVAAVVGSKMPRYCLFGDTVNTASRMESHSAAMRVHVSGATAELLRQAPEGAGFGLESRGEILVKGKGKMSTYWLVGADTDEGAECDHRGRASLGAGLLDSSCDAAVGDVSVHYLNGGNSPSSPFMNGGAAGAGTSAPVSAAALPAGSQTSPQLYLPPFLGSSPAVLTAARAASGDAAVGTLRAGAAPSPSTDDPASQAATGQRQRLYASNGTSSATGMCIGGTEPGGAAGSSPRAVDAVAAAAAGGSLCRCISASPNPAALQLQLPVLGMGPGEPSAPGGAGGGGGGADEASSSQPARSLSPPMPSPTGANASLARRSSASLTASGAGGISGVAVSPVLSIPALPPGPRNSLHAPSPLRSSTNSAGQHYLYNVLQAPPAAVAVQTNASIASAASAGAGAGAAGSREP
ncbi:hypothetical protein HXX76_014494 [Chlamydomonas incerta]|uniref:Guanylate cyclase n=1 Tax=Chlamydomonas incerta TaxID=51695 RepID=A0A835SF80_CHLIN|nr:hypothetical protein HXX76_014494 [Chlamydomonas incerta]|eukprot:KAG2424441.1 hypothetical protein HXX76_014494 [Chlamydomonas incerta]